MATRDEYVIRYHHGGTLVKEGQVSYIDGTMAEFTVDPDKLCYWDLLGDMKELGYDIKKSVGLYFIDGDGVLKPISDDKGTITLVDQLRKQWVVEIYVECSGVDHDISIPEILRDATDIAEDLGGMNDNSDDSESESGYQDFEERLVDVPFINYSSDSDEERENARENVSKYVQFKKSIYDNADESDNEDGDKERSLYSAGCHAGTSDAMHVNKDGKVPGYESEYIESSDPGSYMDTSDSDASDARRHKSSKMYYDPSVPLVDFSLNLRFDDLKMFKKELVEFSTRKGFEFKYMKNDSIRVRAKCSAKGCTWLILCSWCSGKKRYVVKYYEPNHSCLLGTSRNKRVTAHIIARKFGDVISSMPFIRPRHLKALVRRELGVFITHKVCRNSKAFVVKKVEQQFKDDFKVLNNYAMELKATNPSSSVFVISERQCPSELPTFQKIYICLSAVREGFIAGCRRVIGIDGCFLKGLLKGQLLVAVGRDGNNQMFPIAWAIVDKETTRSWTWFLENLKTDLCIGDGLGWALISDMQKGLIHAVNSLFPLIEHRMCARHIYARWGKQHQGKDLQLQFWNIARSPNQPEMQKQLESMRKVKGGERAVEDLLDRWPISGWCAAFFNTSSKCDCIDNNMCETFNGVILEARSKPVITMLEEIRKYVMNRIVTKRGYAMKWQMDFGSNIISKIEKEKHTSGKWQVDWNGAASHEVYWDDPVLQTRDSYDVRISTMSCSCQKWDRTGIPCQHALAAIAFHGENPLSYISEWFKKDAYLRAYQFSINPVKGRRFWPTSEEGPLLPPIAKRMPGRPPKKRKREPLEGKNRGTKKISREGRVFKCGMCHQEGHNKRRCPQKINYVPIGNISSSGQRRQEGRKPKGNKMAVAASNEKEKKKKHEESKSHGGEKVVAVSKGKEKKKKHEGSKSVGGEKIVAASKGKEERVATSKRGSWTIFRGHHTGGLIIGGEMLHNSSFISSRELLARRNSKLASQTTQVEASQQTSSTAEFADIPT